MRSGQRSWSLGQMTVAMLLPVLVVMGGVGVGTSSAAEAESLAHRISFSQQIRPILADRCFTCHGPDEGTREADLRLDQRESATKQAIRPGRSADSLLIKRVTANHPDDRMPPPESKKPPLTPAEIELLRRWIDEGAVYDEHWAFVRPQRPPVPAAPDPAWAINAIDHFIAQKHRAEGLRPAPQADARTLVRRLHFDLVGLPPRPEDVEAFAADPSPAAYEKLVDRLLASPHFGERMAIYWLDVVRYGDTCGYHSDNHRDIWLYRDYVIEAFNSNKPFDQFTREQLAGDLLPGATRQQKIASGYNRLLLTTEEGGAQPKEYEAKYAADRVRNTATAWMGATMGCAQCHNHKYDPYTMRDFYSFAAFFADVKEKAVGRQEQTPMPTPEQAAELARLDAEIAALKAHADEPSKAKLAEVQKRREALLQQIPTTLITESVPPRTVRILPRGNWQDASGEVVQPAVPAFLGKLETPGRRATRLDLANWLVARDNPMVARVFVNRVWKLLFGQGIARTLDDCGTQGARPTHPELLDWLAVEFVESGWNVKRLVKLMVMSRTYRQSSRGTAESLQKDPANLWLARQGRFRLDAELVRDNALAISGLLVPKVGGPSVKPYQPDGYWDFLNFPKRQYVPDPGENQYRRGLYTYWQRTLFHPSLQAFDAPSREESCPERARSNTPLQALVLLNDPTYVEAARVFAARLLRQGGASDAERVASAMRQALARNPTPDESRILLRLLEKHRQEYRHDEPAARALAQVGFAKAPEDIPPAELAAWTSVARTVLNLHETVTRQ